MALKKGYKALLAEADAEVEAISAAEAMALMGDEDVLIVDLRDVRELKREGYSPGSVHAPRGMLEFWVDPESPYHKEIFASGKRMVLHCAAGWRSALAAKTLQDMGLENVCHMAGGFDAWKEAGGTVEFRK
jgi:rhodanese-related sulfurtransferase